MPDGRARPAESRPCQRRSCGPASSSGASVPNTRCPRISKISNLTLPVRASSKRIVAEGLHGLGWAPINLRPEADGTPTAVVGSDIYTNLHALVGAYVPSVEGHQVVVVACRAQQDRIGCGIHKRDEAGLRIIAAADQEIDEVTLDREHSAADAAHCRVTEFGSGRTVLAQRSLVEFGAAEVRVAHKAHGRIAALDRVVIESGVADTAGSGPFRPIEIQGMGALDSRVFRFEAQRVEADH